MVDRRWAMTKQVRPLHQAVHRLLQQRLRAGVDVGGRLVQDEQPPVGQHGAGDGQQLLLAAGEVRHVVADDGVIAGRAACG